MRTLTLTLALGGLLCGCCDKPMEPGTITYLRVVQSENTVDDTLIVVGPGAGDTEVTMPPTSKPKPAREPESLPVEAETPAQRIEASGSVTYVRVVQSENPAGQGTIVIEPERAEMSTPPTYQPPEAPKAASPAQKALGGLVWFGGALVVLGVLGIALRFLPWTAAIGRVVPIGLSVVVGLAGVLLIALSTVLDSAPWWAIGLCVAGVVGVGIFVAMRDNWKLLKR